MSRRTDSLNAYEVGLTSGISDVDTSFPVESTVGLIAPGYLVINPDDPTKREYFKYTIINGSNLEMPNTGFRGLRGSASGASAHLAGARVRAVAVGQWLDDIFSDIEDLEAAQAAFLLLDGTRAMTGDLNMGGNQVQVLGTPTLNDDATTKLYVDAGDDTVRGEFAAADDVVRGEFAAADLLLLPLDGTRDMTGPLVAVPGTALLPGIAFVGAVDTGVYLSTEDVVITIGGGDKLRIGDTEIRFGVSVGAPVVHIPGGVTSPHYSFADAPTMGLMRITSGSMGLTFNGVASAFEFSQDRMRAVGLNGFYIQTNPGINDPTAPTYAFRDDPDTGMYRLSPNIIGLSAGGAEVFRASTTQVRLQHIFGNTGAGGANIVIDSGGTMKEISSAMATKAGFAPLLDPFAVVRALNPFSFSSILEDEDPDKRWVGFGNEEVIEAIPEAESGSHYDLRAVVAYCVAALQKLIPEEA